MYHLTGPRNQRYSCWHVWLLLRVVVGRGVCSMTLPQLLVACWKSLLFLDLYKHYLDVYLGLHMLLSHVYMPLCSHFSFVYILHMGLRPTKTTMF